MKIGSLFDRSAIRQKLDREMNEKRGKYVNRWSMFPIPAW
jgi:hypothetical protein